MTSAEEPQDLHKLFEQALNSGDLDALVALYAFDGLLMARSGPARGIGAIRKAQWVGHPIFHGCRNVSPLA
jgi:ketosteroid isomerase-like protein